MQTGHLEHQLLSLTSGLLQSLPQFLLELAAALGDQCAGPGDDRC
ncbi:hypothetical protein [Streptomyces sp. MAI_2237]